MRKRREAMGVACVQEHNLSPDTWSWRERPTRRRNSWAAHCSLVISFGRAEAPDSEYREGYSNVKRVNESPGARAPPTVYLPICPRSFYKYNVPLLIDCLFKLPN